MACLKSERQMQIGRGCVAQHLPKLGFVVVHPLLVGTAQGSCRPVHISNNNPVHAGHTALRRVERRQVTDCFVHKIAVILLPATFTQCISIELALEMLDAWELVLIHCVLVKYYVQGKCTCCGLVVVSSRVVWFLKCSSLSQH